jgi:hypothetical protein
LNRFFSAHIHILESNHQHGIDATVLVAREAGGRMFAVERVSWRKYAICRLAEWVKEDDLSVKSERQREEPAMSKKRRCGVTEDMSVVGKDGGREWWKSAAVAWPASSIAATEDDQSVPSPRMLDMRRTTQKANDIPNAVNPVMPGDLDAGNQFHLHDSLDSVPAAPAPGPQDVLQDLAKHYLEALYLSRTSLAYFTKGPLSRARAAATACTSQTGVNAEGHISTVDLIQFLRQSVLTSTIMDKKYRDGVAGIIKELPVRGIADASPIVPKKKKKRKWKPKRDKAGLFVDEQEFVEKWWVEDDIDSSPTTETADAIMRKRIARIRNRETFLQIILCLEILALEASLSAEDRRRQEATTVGLESQDAGETQQEETQALTTSDVKPTKQKKKQDLPALLETLLDKLTIWHSLESNSPAKARVAAVPSNVDQPSENDELHGFCIEVIVPFYISRVPQHANAVNKKLGGPIAPSPVKRKVSSKISKDTTRKPGEPALRQPPPEKKPRQPLARVSTETDRQSSKQRHSVPTLHRASTDSDFLLTHIKREASESVPPIDSIPQAKASTKPQRVPRPSLMSSLSRREVDLSAMSAASEAKMKKKADVEEKLREAISTLKKPNRAAAVKEVAESADASFAKALAKGKGQQLRGKTATANGAGAREDKAWLIAATPSRHVRSVKVVKGTPYHGQNDSHPHETDALPSSGSSALVPSTSARLKEGQHYHRDQPPPASTLAIPVTGHRPRFHELQSHRATNAIEETPSRGFARFMPAGLAREPGTLESPIASRKAAVQQTPSKPDKSTGKSTDPAWGGVATTPLPMPLSQSRVARPLVEASPNPMGLKGSAERFSHAEKEKSIYETLGWDDEGGYEELA